MRSETIPGPTTLYVLQPPRPLPQTVEPQISDEESAARISHRPAQHDATLLVAALEHLEVQRTAIEWLLDADLLALTLV